MSTFIIILILVAIVGVVVYFSAKKHNQLVSEGKIISRRTDFMENAEEFTLKSVDKADITEAIKALNYSDMRTSMKGSSENQSFTFTGGTWGARLRKLSDDGNQMVYRFEFTNWKTRNGMAQDALNMNQITTAVEKLFLSFDPSTQVRSVPMEIKTKHNLF